MPDTHPLFSVIMPVFSTPLEYVRDALVSLDRQDYAGAWELIVWNDGSPAKYHRELLDLLHQFEHIDITFGHSYQNQGLCFARNNAIAMANGSWFVLLDADDQLTPDALTAIAAHIDDELDLLYTDHEFVSATMEEVLHVRRKDVYQKLYEAFKGSIADPLLHATYIFHCQIIKAEAFKAIGGFRTDLESGEEVDLHLRLGERRGAMNIGHVQQVVYRYRDNPTSVVHDARYYTQLIANISQILVEGAQRRGFDVGEAVRVGRAINTHAAHYQLRYGDGRAVQVPWFNPDTLEVVENYDALGDTA